MEQFKYTIEKKSDNSLYIEGFLPIGKGEFSKNWIYLSIKSIPLLCSKLTEEAIFNRKISASINNSIETISFDFNASRERPALEIYCKSNIPEVKKKRGFIDIPIHPLGDKKLNMTYITPFLEDLKKYLD